MLYLRGSSIVTGCFFAVLLLACCLQTAAATEATSDLKPFKVFKIDLNKEPIDRFRESSSFYKEEIRAFVAAYTPYMPVYSLETF